MEKIKVKIGWGGENYSCVIENVNGIVVASHSTLEGTKKEIKSALEFHVEGSVDDGDDIPEFIINGEYELEFELQTSAILKQLDGVVTRSALSKATQINERQLGHYIQGKREAREETRMKVLDGIKRIREELLNVV